MPEREHTAHHPGVDAPLWRIVSSLGVAQIISWGTLYYSLAVLVIPIREDLGCTDLTIFGAFTFGLLVSGLASPLIGRQIDAAGGRNVMTAGSLAAGLALVLMAAAEGPLLFTFGWMFAGLAMAACLYDPAFASLHQIAPSRYRRAVTGLTLFGGFASTVFWPLSHWLAAEWGWRMTLVAFAALHIVVCAPIHRTMLPASRRAPLTQKTGDAAVPFATDARFVWLAASFAAATFVFSALSAYMMLALGARGFSVAEAVWIGALIGPMQVLARIVEWFFGGKLSAITVGYAAFVLALGGMTLLNFTPPMIGYGVLFALLYGASNGILTIARGVAPAELFGPQGQGALLGALAQPSFFTKALAPALFAAALSAGVSIGAGLVLLAAASALALIFFWLAARPSTPGNLRDGSISA